MYVRKRLEIGWRDLGSALVGALLRGTGLVRGDRTGERRALERTWSPAGQGFASLSVRTALDLYLTARAWPEGSEVLVTALNIPDMTEIIRRHGLVPVPVDFDMEELMPRRDDLERAHSSRCRGILVAQLFGARCPLDDVHDFAAEHDLDIIEDCAQAFTGLDYTGDPRAVISLFSFGPIKTATALGGALSTVRDPELRERMEEIRDGLPVQSSGAYLRRVIKYAGLKAVSYPWTFRGLLLAARLVGKDHDALLRSAVRGFAGADLLPAIRKQCSLPLLRLLRRRLAPEAGVAVQRRGARGAKLLELLPGDVFVPGRRRKRHSFWVFPVAVENPERTVATLRAAGFDAAHRATLDVVPPTDGTRPSGRAADELPRIIYLPCYPEMPAKQLARMANILGAREAETATRPAALGVRPRAGVTT